MKISRIMIAMAILLGIEGCTSTMDSQSEKINVKQDYCNTKEKEPTTLDQNNLPPPSKLISSGSGASWSPDNRQLVYSIPGNGGLQINTVRHFTVGVELKQ